MIRDRERLLEQLRQLHTAIQRAVVAATERTASSALAAVVADESDDDTIYALDRVSEDYLVEWFARVVAPERPLLLVAEGLPDQGNGPGMLALPRGIGADEVEVRIWSALGHGAATLDDLCARARLPVTSCLTAVTRLELRGVIECALTGEIRRR